MDRRTWRTTLACNDCGRRFTARSTSAFSHPAFPDNVIALAVRRSVRFRLSYADVVEWLAERGLDVNRSTMYRWVQRFLPLFQHAARAHRHTIGQKWRVDETVHAAPREMDLHLLGNRSRWTGD